MTKYQRRYQGSGRFRRQDFGDLGLRAKKEEQDRVTKSLERTARQLKERGQEQISDLKGIAETQAKNAEKLNQLNNDVFQNEYRNIGIRSKREVENLEAQAKELGKEKEWWKDFSTTQAWKIGESVNKTLVAADTIRGKHLADNTDWDLQALIQKDAFGFLETDMEKDVSGLLTAMQKGDSEAYETAKGLLNEKRKSNVYLSEQAATYVSENKEILINDAINDLRRTVEAGRTNDPNSPGLESIIQEGMESYGRRLLNQLQISEASPGGRKIVKLFAQEGRLKYASLYGKRQYLTGQENIKASFTRLKGDRNNPTNFADFVQTTALAWTTDGKGRYFAPLGNQGDALQTATLFMVKELADNMSEANDILDMVIPLRPDQNEKSKRETIREKLSNRDITTLVEEAMVDKLKTKNALATETRKAGDTQALSEIQQELKDNPQLLKTQEGIAQIESRYKAAVDKNYINTKSYIANLIGYNKDSKSTITQQWMIKEAVKNQDWSLFNELYLQLDEADQKKLDLDGTWKVMDFYSINSRELTTNKILSRIETKLKQDLSADQIKKGLSSSAIAASEEMRLDVLNELVDILGDEKLATWSDRKKIDEAFNRVYDRVDKKEGKYWHLTPSDTGDPRIVFPHFQRNGENFEKEQLTQEQIKKALVPGNTLEQILSRHIPEQNKRLIALQELGNVAKDISNGGSFHMPEIVKEIYKLLPATVRESERFYEEDILNEILKKEGFKVTANPGYRGMLESLGVNPKSIPYNQLQAQTLYYTTFNETGEKPISDEVKAALTTGFEALANQLGYTINSKDYIRLKRRFPE